MHVVREARIIKKIFAKKSMSSPNPSSEPPKNGNTNDTSGENQSFDQMNSAVWEMEKLKAHLNDRQVEQGTAKKMRIQEQQQQQPIEGMQVGRVPERVVIDRDGELKYAAAVCIYQPNGINVREDEIRGIPKKDLLRAKIAAARAFIRYAKEARKDRDIGKRERWRKIYPDLEVYLKIIERELSELKGRYTT
jgi:hypothetical protein